VPALRPDPPSSAAAPARPRAVFRHRSFTLLWGARLTAGIGVQMQSVAVGWLIYNLTGSVFDLGLIGLAQFLPTICLALFAGQAADRYDRRHILLACYIVEFAVACGLLTLTLTGAAAPGPILTLLVIFGAARAFESPTTAALLPNVVPRSEFANAAAWSASGNQSAIILGPAVGGLLFTAGPQVVFATTAALVGVAALLVSAMPEGRGDGERRAMSWTTLVAGIAFIRSRSVVLGAISLDLFAVLLGGATALLPVYARDILMVGPWGLGMLRSAPAIGGLAMTVLLAHRPIGGSSGRTMFATVAAFGCATIVFGLSTNFLVSLAALAAIGASDMISVVIRTTLVQLSTPDEMRGRVSAIDSIFTGTSNQLGQFESGVTAAYLGTVPAVVLGGVGTLAVTTLWAWWFPALRQFDRVDGGSA